MLDDIELIISKLLDPAKTLSNENLSLEQILLRLDEYGDDLTEQLKNILEDLRNDAQDIHQRRNKRLSHYDLNSTITRSKNIFTKASRLQINEILKKIREYLNIIDREIFNNTTIYEYNTNIGDAEILLNNLKRSESYKLLEKEKKIEHGYWRKNGPFKNA